MFYFRRMQSFRVMRSFHVIAVAFVAHTYLQARGYLRHHRSWCGQVALVRSSGLWAWPHNGEAFIPQIQLGEASEAVRPSGQYCPALPAELGNRALVRDAVTVLGGTVDRSTGLALRCAA